MPRQTASEGGYFADRVGIGTATPPRTLSVNGDVAMTGSLYRSAADLGGFIGTYNNVGANTLNSNPIYSMGSSFAPSSTTLSSMYGIGYGYTAASFIDQLHAASFGQYVAADGDARIFLAASSNGCSYMPILRKTQQPCFGVGDNDNQTISCFTTVGFDTENFDQNADFSAGTFTAPITGQYLLATYVRLASVNEGGYVWMKLITSNRTYHWIYTHNTGGGGQTYVTPTISVVADMDASDTAYVQICNSVGTAATQGATDSQYTYFSGYLLG